MSGDFDFFDKDENGLIDLDEWVALVIQKMEDHKITSLHGVPINEETVEEMFSMMDCDDDGNVNFDGS